MKTIAICCLTVIGMIGGCNTQNNAGYPAKVKFGHKGGEKVVTGRALILDIEISDYNGNSNFADFDWSNQIDTARVTYKWLTVAKPPNEDKLILSAAPNSSQDSRKLYVRCTGGLYEYLEIKVTQK